MLLGDKQLDALIVAASLLVVVSSYVLVSRKDKSYINFFTPAFVLAVATNYALQFLYLALFEPAGSTFAYAYCYATYAAVFFCGALTYRWLKVPSLGWSTPLKEIRWSPWILLALAWLVYMPILIEFRDLLTTPREIYMRTRTGYGLEFFGSAFLGNIGFILLLFKKRRHVLETVVYLVSLGIMDFLHGSKGHIIYLAFIWALYRVYVARQRIHFWRATAVISLVLALGCAMFVAFGTFEDVADVAQSMAEYSDYTRNAMLVIDDRQLNLSWGALTLEGEFYSRIPRAIMPNKPKNFGTFALAQRYYPDWYNEDTGSPAFGIGTTYADIGYATILYLGLWGCLTAALAKAFIRGLSSHPHPSNFIMLVFFSDISLLPLGAGYLLPEHLLVATALAGILAFNWRLLPSLATRRIRFSSHG